MLHKLGIPTWFLTLLAVDLYWPQMIQAVAYQFRRKLSREDVLKMSMAERSKYLHQNPVTGVRMFQHRIQSFFAQYLLSDDAPKIDQDPDEVVLDFIDKYITATLPNYDHAYEKIEN